MKKVQVLAGKETSGWPLCAFPLKRNHLFLRSSMAYIFTQVFMFVKHKILILWCSVCGYKIWGLWILKNACIQRVLKQPERHVSVTSVSMFVRIYSDIGSEVCFWSSINQWQIQHFYILGLDNDAGEMQPVKCIFQEVSKNVWI